MTQPAPLAPIPSLDDLAGDWQAPSDEHAFSLPAITTRLGTLQAAWSPTGFQNFTLPPTGLPSPTARLLRLNAGHSRMLDGAGVSFRWRAYEIERRLDAPDLKLRSRLRLSDRRPLALERLHLEAPGAPQRVFIVISGLARVWQFTDYWNLPGWDVPQRNAWWDGQSVWLDDTKTFGAACFNPSVAPRAVHVADSLSALQENIEEGRTASTGRGRYVALEYAVDGTLDLDLAAEQGSARPEDRSAWWRPASPGAGFEQEFDAARADWEAVWRAAFTHGNHEFSGHLPRLVGAPQGLSRLYYHGVIALLNSRREFRAPTAREAIATGGQAIWSRPTRPLRRVYTWGGTEGAPTTSFLWELQLQAPLLALLDPAALREQLQATWALDIHAHWGLEAISGRGAGMWYGVNDGAMLTSALDYLRITGDLAWLEHLVAGRSVRERLLDAATHADTLEGDAVAGGSGLADYGEAQNILECVGRYEHRVAGFNALRAWGLRQAARLYPERAPDLLARAGRVGEAVRGLLEPGGYFACLRPVAEGLRPAASVGAPLERTPVRTVLDFIYVGRYLNESLNAGEREAMTGFVRRELLTPAWLVALSPDDADAFTPTLPTFQRFRADHQASGAYDAWPALVASTLIRLGHGAGVLEWLERVAGVTREGPLCQAHYVGLTGADRASGRVTRASFTNGNCATEACGCAFTTMILEDLYGVSFTLDEPGAPRFTGVFPGLTGSIEGLRGAGP